jgi:hypothetical protein
MCHLEWWFIFSIFANLCQMSLTLAFQCILNFVSKSWVIRCHPFMSSSNSWMHCFHLTLCTWRFKWSIMWVSLLKRHFWLNSSHFNKWIYFWQFNIGTNSFCNFTKLTILMSSSMWILVKRFSFLQC